MTIYETTAPRRKSSPPAAPELPGDQAAVEAGRAAVDALLDAPAAFWAGLLQGCRGRRKEAHWIVGRVIDLLVCPEHYQDSGGHIR